MKLHKASKRTIALFAAALILLSSGGVMGVKAVPAVQSQNYDATMVLDQLRVALVENGQQTAKNDKVLLTALRDSKLSPGKKYKEEIGAQNTGTADEYVRIVVRKYWTKNGEKNKELTPDLIHLTYGNGDYNTGAWTLNKAESTDEMAVYYCQSKVAAGKPSPLLFDSVSVDASVLGEVKETTSKEGNKTIYNYEYKYDGFTVNVEAEAQAVQTHNAAQAIKSVWGVDASKTGIKF